MVSRRHAIRLLGLSAVGASSGCTSVSLFGTGSDDHDPGALVVRNRDSLPHVVGVSVTVPESFESENASRDALLVAENGREARVAIDTDETKAYPGFLSGSEMYRVAAWTGSTGRTARDDTNRTATTIEFSPAAAAAPDADGSYLTIAVERYGELSPSVTYV